MQELSIFLKKNLLRKFPSALCITPLTIQTLSVFNQRQFPNNPNYPVYFEGSYNYNVLLGSLS